MQDAERDEVVIAAQGVRRSAGRMKIACERDAAVVPLRLGIVAAVAAEFLVEPPHVRGGAFVLEKSAKSISERVSVTEVIRLPIRSLHPAPGVGALTVAARRECRGVGVFPRAGKPGQEKRARRCRCRLVMRLAGVN